MLTLILHAENLLALNDGSHIWCFPQVCLLLGDLNTNSLHRVDLTVGLARFQVLLENQVGCALGRVVLACDCLELRAVDDPFVYHGNSLLMR